MKKFLVVVFLGIILLFAVSTVFAVTAKDYYDYGITLFNDGNYNGAFKYFVYAIKLDPKNPQYYNTAGNCFAKTGNTAAAQKYYDYASKFAPAAPEPPVIGAPEAPEPPNVMGGTQMPLPAGKLDYGNDSTRENILAVSGYWLGVPDVGLHYEKALNNSLSIGPDIGYGFTGSGSVSGGGGGISMSGGGLIFGADLNWYPNNHAMNGWYIGPNIDYLLLTIKESDTTQTLDQSFNWVTTTSTTTFDLNYLFVGAHGGYRLIFSGGFLMDFYGGVDFASVSMKTSGSGILSGFSAAASGVTFNLGLDLGYGF